MDNLIKYVNNLFDNNLNIFNDKINCNFKNKKENDNISFSEKSNNNNYSSSKEIDKLLNIPDSYENRLKPQAMEINFFNQK